MFYWQTFYSLKTLIDFILFQRICNDFLILSSNLSFSIFWAILKHVQSIYLDDDTWVNSTPSQLMATLIILIFSINQSWHINRLVLSYFPILNKTKKTILQLHLQPCITCGPAQQRQAVFGKALPLHTRHSQCLFAKLLGSIVSNKIYI